MNNLITHINVIYSFTFRHFTVKLMAGNIMADFYITSSRPEESELKAKYPNIENIEYF